MALPRFLSIALGLLVCGCSSATPNDDTSSSPTAVVRGAGATFPAPLYKKWIEEYQQAFPGRSVTYDVVGSGEGVARFLDGSVDFGASDAALTDEEIAQVKRGVVLVPTTAGSIAIAYNLPDVTQELKMRRDVYAGIFLGKITHWDDPRIKADNPKLELPHADIRLVARQDGSGTTFAFTNHMSAISKEWEAGPSRGKLIEWPGSTMLARGNEGVAGEIQRSPYTIGYVEYGIAKRAGLRMAALENKAGSFIKPSGSSGLATLLEAELPENLRAFFPDPEGRNAYPIVSLTWFLIYKDYEKPGQADAVKQFVAWCLDEGQQYCESLGYIRLSPSAERAGHHALESVD